MRCTSRFCPCAGPQVDQRGEVQYVDHLKTWIAIIFSLRKSRMYEQILGADWALVDLSQSARRPGGLGGRTWVSQSRMSTQKACTHEALKRFGICSSECIGVRL